MTSTVLNSDCTYSLLVKFYWVANGSIYFFPPLQSVHCCKLLPKKASDVGKYTEPTARVHEMKISDQASFWVFAQRKFSIAKVYKCLFPKAAQSEDCLPAADDFLVTSSRFYEDGTESSGKKFQILSVMQQKPKYWEWEVPDPIRLGFQGRLYIHYRQCHYPITDFPTAACTSKKQFEAGQSKEPI